MSDPVPAVEQAIRDAEAALGVAITIRDDVGFFATADGASLLGPTRRTHRPPPACGIGFDRRCIDHCRHAVNRQAAAASGPFLHHCWKGLTEVVVPISDRGVTRALLFAGAWRRTAQPPATATGLPAAWRRHFRALPRHDEAHATRLGRLLTLVAAGLVHLRDGHRLGGDDRRARILRHVADHHARGASIAGLARILGLSPSRAGHLVQECFGVPLGALVMTERLARAKGLLLTTEMSVAAIAQRVGMPDACHFNRAFRAAVGLPPGRFRRLNRAGE